MEKLILRSTYANSFNKLVPFQVYGFLVIYFVHLEIIIMLNITRKILS
jgi:hypothetical protein